MTEDAGKLLLLTPLSSDMAEAVLLMLKNVGVPFEAAEKVLEIRQALEAIVQGKHEVMEKSDDGQE